MSRSGNGVEVRDTSIRRRRACAIRHTYCTSLLMAGVQPAYIAAQAGHSVKVLLEVSSRWLPGADGGRQKALSKDQALGYASNFENTPISPGNTPVGKYTCETVLQELNCKRLTNTTYWSKS